MFTVGYFGSKGTHLIGLTELNEVAAGRGAEFILRAGQWFHWTKSGANSRSLSTGRLRVPQLGDAAG